MKIFQTPSYDRFCLFEMERKSKDFRGMDGNVVYKNKQIDSVEISNEGRRALREKLREIKPKVEEPIGYELTIQDTNEVEWEHYTSMREYSGLTLKDGKYNLEDVMKSMMDAYETRYNYIVKEHENGERQVSYDLTGENSLTLDEDLAGLDRAYNKRLANLAGYIVCQQTNDGSKFFQTTNMKKNTVEQKIYKSWNDNWATLSTYFKYPEAVRRLIYTTNAIEGFNRQLRKVTKKNRSLHRFCW